MAILSKKVRRAYKSKFYDNIPWLNPNKYLIIGDEQYTITYKNHKNCFILNKICTFRLKN
jgi:hypothetical protein